MSVATSDKLEGFVNTSCRNECIGRGNSWDDVLDDPHCQLVGYTLDAEELCSLQSSLVDPPHVIWTVFVYCLLLSEGLRPLKSVSVLNAVLW